MCMACQDSSNNDVTWSLFFWLCGGHGQMVLFVLVSHFACVLAVVSLDKNYILCFFCGPRKTSQPTGRSGGMSQSKTSSISALAATMRLAAISNPTFRVWDAKMIFDGCWWLGVFGPSGSWELAVIGGRIVNKNLIFVKRRWCLWTEVEACAMALS